MRVLLASLGGTYPLRIGGPSVVAYNLARQFDRKGLEIVFVFGISKKDFVDAYHEFSTRFSGNVRLIQKGVRAMLLEA